MLGRLRKWRDIILKEAGLLRRYRSMSQAELQAAFNAPSPLPTTWAGSLNELHEVFA